MLYKIEDYPDTPEGKERFHAIAWILNRAPRHVTVRQKEEIESELFNCPELIPGLIAQAETTSGERYRSLHVIEQEREEKRITRTRLKRERAQRPKLKHVEFIVIDGKLHRQEYWGPRGVWDKSLDDPRPPIPCGKRVMINGEQRTSALVVHELLTGERVRNLPRTPSQRAPKRFQARVYIKGRLTHIGCYATPEERDAVQAMAKIGIYPPGFEVRP